MQSFSKVLGRDVVLSTKRNRWLVSAVMVLAVIAFVGFAVIAPLTQALRDSRSAADPSPTGTPVSAQTELQARAKGYEQVLQREPDNQTALKGLIDTRIEIANSSRKPDDLKAIIAPLEKLAQLNPNQTDYTVLLAQAKLQTGDREGAAQAYRDILAKKPGDLNALQGIVELQVLQERPEAAVGLLQDTLQTADEVNKTKPGTIDVASVRLLLARVYAEQKRYEEAIAIYDEIIKSDAKDYRPLLGKAMILQTQGKKAEAQPLFTTATDLAPAQYKDQIKRLASGPSPVPSATTSPNSNGSSNSEAPVAPSAPSSLPEPAASPK
jgi:tetratricopeptide (TPR) repeat protein